MNYWCPLLIQSQAKRVVSYAESGDEDDEDDVFNPSVTTKSRGRMLKKRKTNSSPDTDDFIGDDGSDLDDVNAGKSSFLL